MRLFYNFLDEKYEDELVLPSLPSRVEVEAWTKGMGGVDWGGVLIEATTSCRCGTGTSGRGEKASAVGTGASSRRPDDSDEEEDDEAEGAVPRVIFITVAAAEKVERNAEEHEARENGARPPPDVEGRRGRADQNGGVPYGARRRGRRGGRRGQVGVDVLEEDPRAQGTAKEEKEAQKKLLASRPRAWRSGVTPRAFQEYREEQAHRRAAIRLMFQTAMNSQKDDEDEDAPPMIAAVDMQQFAAMVELPTAR